MPTKTNRATNGKAQQIYDSRTCAGCGRTGCRHWVTVKGKKRPVCTACNMRFRRRGDLSYRHTVLHTEEQLNQAANWRIVDEMSWSEIAAKLGVCRFTVMRRVKAFWKNNR